MENLGSMQAREAEEETTTRDRATDNGRKLKVEGRIFTLQDPGRFI
jgi:hypothetical protein